MSEQEHKEFEAWAIDQPRVASEEDCFEYDRRSPDRYASGTVQSLWLAYQAGAARAALSQQAIPDSFQQRVAPWLLACFGEEIAADTSERNHRFLEEALELVQACGCTQSEAHQLVDYVFGRPVGEVQQEAGGVMVTLAALCRAQGFSMHEAGETELARIWTKVESIRAKQAAKPKHSPLPGPAAALAQQAVPARRIVVTEAMHVAACKVLLRAHGLDGLPQRMLDAMLAAAHAASAAPQASQGPAPAPGDEREAENAVAMAWNTVRAEARALTAQRLAQTGGLSDLLAAVEEYGDRRVAQAALAQQAVPEGHIAVPVNVLNDASRALGNFVSDHGWSEADMQAMDNLDAYLAPPAVQSMLAAAPAAPECTRSHPHEGMGAACQRKTEEARAASAAAQAAPQAEQREQDLLEANQSLRDMLDDARAELAAVREALGVPYEPHQSLQERTLLAAQKAEREPMAWPKARDVGRLHDMSPAGHLRVGMDGDNDVFVEVFNDQQEAVASVEFCNPGAAGGGRSSRTRKALIALMVAMEADNAERPNLDWWARRGGIGKEGA